MATGSKAVAQRPSEHIVSPVYDCVFFLLPPTAALCLGILISDSGFANDYFEFYDQDVTWSGLLIGIFIHAHLFAVFFRSTEIRLSASSIPTGSCWSRWSCISR